MNENKINTLISCLTELDSYKINYGEPHFQNKIHDPANPSNGETRINLYENLIKKIPNLEQEIFNNLLNVLFNKKIDDNYLIDQNLIKQIESNTGLSIKQRIASLKLLLLA